MSLNWINQAFANIYASQASSTYTRVRVEIRITKGRSSPSSVSGYLTKTKAAIGDRRWDISVSGAVTNPSSESAQNRDNEPTSLLLRVSKRSSSGDEITVGKARDPATLEYSGNSFTQQPLCNLYYNEQMLHKQWSLRCSV
ncbi:hypothetical protein QAD02_020216 [Eretmocerus hayati]|uniref:Uncharacterized protein n=1 Tax=Eretmocerus hayati TaxID=131215 RepID=A0ACC2PPA0_9HYME|nr:hypothetical protein QAD02_020216 [Eretmocerus hayati]